MNTTTEVTIVGAGPYGLSIAAHLRHMNVNFRIIGSPMHTWRTHMPKGMHLKSAGLSATLFDPEHSTPAHEPNINELGIIIGRKLLELIGGTVALQNRDPRGLEATIQMPARPLKG